MVVGWCANGDAGTFKSAVFRFGDFLRTIVPVAILFTEIFRNQVAATSELILTERPVVFVRITQILRFFIGTVGVYKEQSAKVII